MLKARTLGTVLCLGALTALPACSMFGGGQGSSATGQYRQTSNSGAYNTPSASQTPQAGTTTNGHAAVTPDMIRDVQNRLKQANMYSGQVDGVWGPMTEHGVRQWQQQHNLNASGQLDMATLQAMNVSAENNQYGQNNASDHTGNTQSANGQTNTNQPNYSSAGNHETGGNYSSNTTDHANMPYTTQPNTAPNSNNAPTTNTTNPSQPTH